MFKCILSLLISLSIIIAPVKAKAQEADALEGKITALSINQKAPYAGILLDPVAAAKINTDKKYSLMESQLKLDYETKKLNAEHSLELSTLQAKYDSLKESTDSILMLKSQEIERLQEIASENSNDYTALWVSLGIISGVLLSLGVFYAAVEVQK
tara:strand:+ start:5931 stop:6395 length:465 start_codon:yes stop_codon:yes gene_type:complete